LCLKQEAFENPYFVIDGFKINDVFQGTLGDCWFLAACVGIIEHEELRKMVIPDGQDFNENYNGLLLI
jgi:hypothetical protein